MEPTQPNPVKAAYIAKHNKQFLARRRKSLLNKISTTMYKVYAEDLDSFLALCGKLDITVDTSHLDHDGCLTIDNNLGVEVLEDE